MVSGVTSVPQGNTSSASTTTHPATGRNTLGKDDFMKLLITQLSTQDPLKPMDSQDFGAQLAQFSSLEQMTNVNENLVRLQGMQSALSASASVNLIGKRVDAEGNIIPLASGASQTLSYSLGNDANSVSVEIFDASGNRVNTLTTSGQTAGVNSITWDGKGADGSSLPDGNYTFNVTATDARGNAVTATTYTSGLVTNVVFENGIAKAVVNGARIPVNQITRVS